MVTKKPSNEFEGEFRGGYGNGDTINLFGAVSGPIVKDRVAARATLKYKKTDGLVINSFDGKGLNFDETIRASGRIIFTPSDRLSIDLRGSYFEQDGSASWFTAVDVLGLTGGRITKPIARMNPDHDGPHITDRKIFELSMLIDYETDIGTFTSISAYDDVDTFFDQDLDNTSMPIVANAMQDREIKSFSQELRFTSPDDRRLRYIVGGYYQNTERDVATLANLDFCFLLPLPGCPTPPGTLTGFFSPLPLNTVSGEFDQWAAFAQVNYDLTEALELTLALRYDRDEREQLDLLTGRTDGEVFDDVQPKVSLAYKASEDMLLYATYAEGYKSGAFNPPPGLGSTHPLVVEQEGTRSYEVGFKSSMADNRVTLNGAVFHTDYSDAQIFQLDLQTGGQVAVNADKSKIYGFELEFAARPSESFELNAGFGYTDAEIKNFNGTGLFDGNALPNNPEFSFNAGAQYTIEVSDAASVVPRLDLSHIGRTYFAEDNLLFQPAYSRLDGQITFESGEWSLTFWARNLLSEDYATSAFARTISPLIFGSLGIDVIQQDVGTEYGFEVRTRF